jgi:hypothetical protein
MPYLAEGLRNGEKCICVLSSLPPEDVLARLGEHVDLDLSVERGQLEVTTPAEVYLRTGNFAADDMLSFWKDAATAAEADDVDGVLHDNPYYISPDTLLAGTSGTDGGPAV